MAKNENIETLSRYNVRVHYRTVCHTDYYVYAGSEEEARQKAEEMFKNNVTMWEAQGGDPKIFTGAEVRDEN